MELAQTVRDILISVYLIAGILLMVAMLLFTFLLYKATRALLKSATRSFDNFGKVSDAAFEHIVTPLQEGVSLSKTLGGAVGFLIGFVTCIRGKKSDGDDDSKKKRFGLF